jgi:hypothetical protein
MKRRLCCPFFKPFNTANMADTPDEMFQALNEGQQTTSTATLMKKSPQIAPSASPGKVKTPEADNLIAKNQKVGCHFNLGQEVWRRNKRKKAMNYADSSYNSQTHNRHPKVPRGQRPKKNKKERGNRRRRNTKERNIVEELKSMAKTGKKEDTKMLKAGLGNSATYRVLLVRLLMDTATSSILLENW